MSLSQLFHLCNITASAKNKPLGLNTIEGLNQAVKSANYFMPLREKA